MTKTAPPINRLRHKMGYIPSLPSILNIGCPLLLTALLAIAISLYGSYPNRWSYAAVVNCLLMEVYQLLMQLSLWSIRCYSNQEHWLFCIIAYGGILALWVVFSLIMSIVGVALIYYHTENIVNLNLIQMVAFSLNHLLLAPLTYHGSQQYSDWIVIIPNLVCSVLGWASVALLYQQQLFGYILPYIILMLLIIVALTGMLSMLVARLARRWWSSWTIQECMPF